MESIRAKLVVPAADIERTYNDRIGEYTTPEQVRASHILLKTEGKDEAAIRAQAEDVLKKAKAGADFAALAKQYSRGRRQRAERRRSRLLRPRPHGAGVRRGGLRDGARPDQRSGEDAASASTSSSWSTRRRARRGRSTKCVRSCRISCRWSARSSRPPTSPSRCGRAMTKACRSRHGRQGAGTHRAGERVLRARRTGARARRVARARRADVRDESGRRRRTDSNRTGIRVHVARREAGRVHPEGRRGQGARPRRSHRATRRRSSA